MAHQSRRVGARVSHDDLESGGPHVAGYQPKSSITVKGPNSPGTASKEDRRGKPLYHAYGGAQQQEKSDLSREDNGLAAQSSSGGGGGSGSGGGGLLLSNSLLVPVLVLVWYSFAVGAVTLSKKIMNEVPLPNLLCTAQFLSASVATKMLEDVTSVGTPAGASDASRRLLRPPNFNWQMAQIALSYTLGFVFTNMAFSVVTASFAETVKSAEPISSVLMGFFLLREMATLPTYLTLIPICVGVSISCFHDDSFAMNGFLFAAISNICFSGRAVLAKRLLKQCPGSVSEVEMFRLISLMGLALLVPLTLVTEGAEIYAFLSGDATMTQTYSELVSLLFLNGFAYATYNLTSFLVLNRTSLVTHAVLNCFRRVFIIVFTSFYFDVEISSFNMLGVAMAVLGVCLFAYFRGKDAVSAAKSEKSVA